MAIGLAKIFGMDFNENFNLPYISKSITEFWRRWHITLSSWFRDYIYIPLGGNRKGLVKQIRNILIVWFLTGAWHGASWNFILWGLYFGVILILEKIFILKMLDKAGKICSHIYAIVLILIGWVIFAFEDLSKIGMYLQAMFNVNNFINNETLYYLRNYGGIAIIGIICSIALVKKLIDKLNKFTNKSCKVVEIIMYMMILILCTANLVSDSFNPFLYFRF